MNTMRKINVFTAIMLLCLSLVSVNLLGQAKYDKKVKIKNSDYYAVSRSGKWGVCDMSLRVIIVPKYDDIGTTLVGDYVRVKKNGKWGVCDMSGQEIITPKYDALGAKMVGNYFGVKRNDRWGVCDMNGREIIAPKFDGIGTNMLGDNFKVKLNDKWGVCDKNGHEIIAPRYDDISSNLIGGYFGVKQNDKWGLCNTSDQEIIAPKYDDIGKFNTGEYFQVKINDKYGACDMNGKEVIVPRECDNLSLLGNSYFVIEKNRAKGLMDMNSDMIIPCGVKDIESWVDDVSFILVTTFDNLKGVYSSKGELIVPVLYSRIDGFVSDRVGIRGFKVQNKEGYYGYYTTDGKLLVSPSMGIEDLSVLNNHNYLIAFIGNREGLIDEFGEVVVPVGMYYGFGETEDGSAVIGRKGGKCCEFYPNGKEKFVSEFVNFQEDENHNIIAKQGREELFRKGADVYYKIYDDRGAVGVACNERKIIDCEFEMINFDQVDKRYIYVYQDGYWGVYDLSGNLIIPVAYNNYGSTEKYEIIPIRKGLKWGVCGLDGKVIIEPGEYTGVAEPESNGHIKVQKGNYYGMCDRKGNVVVEPVYTGIRLIIFRPKSKLVYVVEQGDKEGVIDESGKMIIPPIYDCVNGYETPEFYSVTLNGKKGAYDNEGNIIFAPEYNDLAYFLDQGFKYENESGEWVSLDISIDDNGTAYYSYNSDYNEYFDKGESYFEEKNYKKAAKNYKKALEHKQTPDAYYNVGVCYYNIKKYDEAIDWFQQCLNCNPRPALTERAQNLIKNSRLYIEVKEQAREIAAEAVDRVIKKNREDALSILSAILTGNHINSNSNPNPSGNMNYLLDPNYAAWQTQQQEYETYLMQTSGGKSMTFEQWKAISAQAAWNEANGVDYNGVDSNIIADDGNEYKGELSPDQYVATYQKYEEIVQSWFNNLNTSGVKEQDSQGNIKGKTNSGDLQTGGTYATNQMGLKKAQKEMQRIRLEAEKYGVHIQQSKWETATAGY